jgi:hypothetical protein
MSDLRASRLADLWTRHLTGQELSEDESAQLTDAFASDDMFRRRVLHDRQLDGAMRTMADLRERQSEMLATMDQLVRAAALSDGFVERLRPRLRQQQASSWSRRTALGLAVAAALAALFVGLKGRPSRQTASRNKPASPTVMARSVSRPPVDQQVFPAPTGRRAVLLLGSEDSQSPPSRKQIAADGKLRARLEQLGFTVDVLTTEDPEPTLMKAAGNAQVVVLSPSILTMKLSDELISAPVPLVALESSAFERLGLTGTVWKRDLGNNQGRTRELAISNPSHPLAAGLSGEAVVLTRNQLLRWGIPGEEAIVVAHYANEPEGHAALFAYERGRQMPGGPAAARRVAIFLGNDRVINSLTPDGWRLFDAAVTWSAADRR